MGVALGVKVRLCPHLYLCYSSSLLYDPTIRLPILHLGVLCNQQVHQLSCISLLVLVYPGASDMFCSLYTYSHSYTSRILHYTSALPSGFLLLPAMCLFFTVLRNIGAVFNRLSFIASSLRISSLYLFCFALTIW